MEEKAQLAELVAETEFFLAEAVGRKLSRAIKKNKNSVRPLLVESLVIVQCTHL